MEDKVLHEPADVHYSGKTEVSDRREVLVHASARPQRTRANGDRANALEAAQTCIHGDHNFREAELLHAQEAVAQVPGMDGPLERAKDRGCPGEVSLELCPHQRPKSITSGTVRADADYDRLRRRLNGEKIAHCRTYEANCSWIVDRHPLFSRSVPRS